MLAAFAALIVCTAPAPTRALPATIQMPSAAKPGPLTAAERAELVAALAASRATFLEAIDGLTDAQWRFSPGPGRWSISEVAEHVVLVDRGIAGIVANRLGTSPATEPSPAADSLTARIRAFMADRSQKATAPEGFGPERTWADRAALLNAYGAIRDDLARFTDTTSAPLRYHTVRHPSFGPMDGYQWLVMLAAHSDRHVQQIEEVKQAAGFPGGKP